MPVCFWYSGASFFWKNSSKALMNELSWSTPIDLGGAASLRAARVEAAAPASVSVMKSRRDGEPSKRGR